MTEHLNFGGTLVRLLEHRNLSGSELADRAGVTSWEIRAVLAGEEPGERLLRELAPALAFHAVDLFILAGKAIPEELAPLDAAAEAWAPSAAMNAAHLPVDKRRELLEFVRSLPQEERLTDFAPRRPVPIAAAPGSWVMRMLQYRNLNWMGVARTLAVLTPTHLSGATYGVIGAGRQELTPRLVTDFAALLGFDARELAALAGIPMPEVPPPPASEAVDAAALLWETRRLSACQARHVSERARSMREDSLQGYRLNLPGR